MSINCAEISWSLLRFVSAFVKYSVGFIYCFLKSSSDPTSFTVTLGLILVFSNIPCLSWASLPSNPTPHPTFLNDCTPLSSPSHYHHLLTLSPFPGVPLSLSCWFVTGSVQSRQEIPAHLSASCNRHRSFHSIYCNTPSVQLIIATERLIIYFFCR